MNRLGKNAIFVTVSVLLVSLVFSTGFYFGNSQGGFFGNRAGAAENADLTAFWRVWNILDEKFVSASSTESVSPEDKVYGAIEGLVKSYGDPYTVFFPPEESKEFNDTIQGNFEGVGMEISMKDDMLTVVAPLKNSPAERGGIKSGDVVLEIEGKTTVGMAIDEAIRLIRGREGTRIMLLIGREGAEPFSVTLTREVINVPSLEAELRKDGIFVISLFNFSARSEAAFREALREFLLSKSHKLILDVRGNPGGYLDAAVDIASWFLPAGKVIVSEDFAGKQEGRDFRSKGYNIFNNNLQMVVLIDEGSASASEIVAGALQAHDVATLIGTNTFGKGSVQELIDITDETSLKVTIAQWLTPTGDSISDGGLAPDIEVEVTEDDMEDERDPQMEKAVEFLLKR